MLWSLAGQIPAGCFHHHGGSEVALFPPDLHVSVPLLVDALRHGVVAHRLRPRRPGATRPQRRARAGALCHGHPVLYLRVSLLHRSAGEAMGVSSPILEGLEPPQKFH